jgi:hypothetical protein
VIDETSEPRLCEQANRPSLADERALGRFMSTRSRRSATSSHALFDIDRSSARSDAGRVPTARGAIEIGSLRGRFSPSRRVAATLFVELARAA